jgi:hypothetical protein
MFEVALETDLPGKQPLWHEHLQSIKVTFVSQGTRHFGLTFNTESNKSLQNSSNAS